MSKSIGRASRIVLCAAILSTGAMAGDGKGARADASSFADWFFGREQTTRRSPEEIGERPSRSRYWRQKPESQSESWWKRLFARGGQFPEAEYRNAALMNHLYAGKEERLEDSVHQRYQIGSMYIGLQHFCSHHGYMVRERDLEPLLAEYVLPVVVERGRGAIGPLVGIIGNVIKRKKMNALEWRSLVGDAVDTVSLLYKTIGLESGAVKDIQHFVTKVDCGSRRVERIAQGIRSVVAARHRIDPPDFGGWTVLLSRHKAQ